MTLYRYAHDDASTLVAVLDLSPEQVRVGYGYTCIGCGGPLIAKVRGTKRSSTCGHKQQTHLVLSARLLLNSAAKGG